MLKLFRARSLEHEITQYVNQTAGEAQESICKFVVDTTNNIFQSDEFYQGTQTFANSMVNATQSALSHLVEITDKTVVEVGEVYDNSVESHIIMAYAVIAGMMGMAAGQDLYAIGKATYLLNKNDGLDPDTERELKSERMVKIAQLVAMAVGVTVAVIVAGRDFSRFVNESPALVTEFDMNTESLVDQLASIFDIEELVDDSQCAQNYNESALSQYVQENICLYTSRSINNIAASGLIQNVTADTLTVIGDWLEQVQTYVVEDFGSIQARAGEFVEHNGRPLFEMGMATVFGLFGHTVIEPLARYAAESWFGVD